MDARKRNNTFDPTGHVRECFGHDNSDVLAPVRLSPTKLSRVGQGSSVELFAHLCVKR
jgi:hypothetical protein